MEAAHPQRTLKQEGHSKNALIDTPPALVQSMRGRLSRAWSRLQRLGIASLGTLVVGGTVLIFVALNVLAGPMNSTGWSSFRNGVGVAHFPLRYSAQPLSLGSSWSIQAWVAITGVGFGLVSHGYQDAFEHLFEWWSSQQARSPEGLDYARYLNTQHRAPVTYGVRGFPLFATLRYVILAASIAISVGYKFGFQEVDVQVRETASYGSLVQNQYYVPEGAIDGVHLPWLSDFPCYPESRQFSSIPKVVPDVMMPTTSWFDQDSGAIIEYDNSGYNILYALCRGNSPPYRITMAGAIDVQRGWGETLSGGIVTREMVLVATLEEEQGNFRISRNGDGWFRTVSPSTHWVNGTGAGVVIDFRLPDPGTVQIQWADAGPWLTSNAPSTESAAIASRLTYKMHYGVAEVMRTFSFSSVNTLEARVTNFGAEAAAGPILLSTDDSPITTGTRDRSIARRQPWLTALLSDESTTIVDGTSAIVRAAMVGRASVHDTASDKGDDIKGKGIQLLPSSYEPFGPENRTLTRRAREFPDFDYPYFQGDRSGVTGCYIAASGAFLAVGTISILVAVLRIWLGPAELTSWAAQHVYLSQAGLLPSFAESSGLKSGYEVALPEKLGFLRIKVPLEST